MKRFLLFIAFPVFILPGRAPTQALNTIPPPPVMDPIQASKPHDSWFGKDKAGHFVVSALVAGGTGWHCRHHAFPRPGHSVALGAGFSFSLGLSKELSDARRPGGRFSWKDLAADCAGIAVGLVLLEWW